MQQATETLTYATPGARPPRTAPLAVIMFTGLGLIVLGGCFLIGVMLVIHPAIVQGATVGAPITWPQIVFITILSILAAASFAGAITLLIIGTRGLLRVIWT